MADYGIFNFVQLKDKLADELAGFSFPQSKSITDVER